MGIMRERAKAIGAALEIESQLGRGTRVMLIWTEVDKRQRTKDGEKKSDAVQV